MESLNNFFAPVPVAAFIAVIFIVIAGWLFFKNLRMPNDFTKRERERDLLKLRLLDEKKEAYLKSIMENNAAKKPSSSPDSSEDKQEDSVPAN
jgi:hypothetical protein